MVNAQRLAERMREKGISQAELARRIGVSQQAVGKLVKGDSLRTTHIGAIARELETTPEYLQGETDIVGPPPAHLLAPYELRLVEMMKAAKPEQLHAIARFLNGRSDEDDLQRQKVEEELDLVAIPSIDLAYGMGATFTDGHVEEDMQRFPRRWVETISHSPPTLLTWARGRGDSMQPTIHDGDIILFDRSQRHVTEQDAIWAFTVGDIGMIKRLRVRGRKVTILSDNPSVPPDEADAEEVNVVARVVFVGRRI